MSKKHDHGHDDGHGHEAGVPFVPESSLYDKGLLAVTVAVGASFLWYMWSWSVLPLPTGEGTTPAETGVHHQS